MRIKRGILTPCRSLCNLVDGQCTGCGRTEDHIQNWRKYTAEQREKVCAELADWVSV